uniref:ATP synthase complex subunit 8 n=1 Tax=Sinoxylon sp. SIN01 TaxID=1205585 RepID=A0A0S2MNH7_9COLE|nr:ATP synthase F0 subunit 8 [Sinoxylon sp. SIN01]
MPQMAPLNWLTLFLYFTLLFVFINPLNFFLGLKTINKSFTTIKSKSLNWKW